MLLKPKSLLLKLLIVFSIILEAYFLINLLYLPRVYTNGEGYWVNYSIYFYPCIRKYVLLAILTIQIIILILNRIHDKLAIFNYIIFLIFIILTLLTYYNLSKIL